MSQAFHALRLAGLTTLAMVAFAANSVLCRLALHESGLDPAAFTVIRLVSGALLLAALVFWRTKPHAAKNGSWPSAFALLIYATAFSYAYVSLTTGVGALLLFGAVQITMVTVGLVGGERLSGRQKLGFLVALTGFVFLLLPGITAPPIGGSLLMILSGSAWGFYSLRGRGETDPAAATAGNFLRAAGVSLLLIPLGWASMQGLGAGVGYAVLSGALASGLGYVIWYAAVRGLPASTAAVVQLSVPLLAGFGGALLLQEALTIRFGVAAAILLSGIALVVWKPHRIAGAQGERRTTSSKRT